MKTNKTMAVVGVGALFAMTIAPACTLNTNDGSRFAEAIPASSDAALAVPGSGSTGGAKAAASPIHIQSPGGTSYAEWYQFTRDVTDGVDFGTALILGEVLLIVHLPPTSVSTHRAVWGPGQGTALDPVVWRMTVDEIGSSEFDYKLEGRPKASTSEADWRSVLSGHGYGRTRAEHKTGWFLLDNDAFAALDPARGHDNGTIKVTFDGHTWPATIRAEVKHTADAEAFDVTVTHEQDTSGAVDITAKSDIDRPKNGTLEDVVMHSKYDHTGAGRADVRVSGGSMPQTVTASECWDTTFSRSYYTDTAGYKPTSGSAASCAFPLASF